LNQQQNQNQPQQTQPPQMNPQNVQAANAQANNENASELAQSTGQISQLLLAKSKQGFEFGTLNQAAGLNQGTINTQGFTMNKQNQTPGNQAPQTGNQANQAGNTKNNPYYQANQQDQTELASSQGQMSQILKDQAKQ